MLELQAPPHWKKRLPASATADSVTVVPSVNSPRQVCPVVQSMPAGEDTMVPDALPTAVAVTVTV